MYTEYSIRLLFRVVATLAVAWWLGHTVEAGEIYKCEVNGDVSYQQTPCVEGEEDEPVDIVIPTGFNAMLGATVQSSDDFMTYNYTPQWKLMSGVGSHFVTSSGDSLKDEWYEDQYGNKIVKHFRNGKQESQNFIKG